MLNSFIQNRIAALGGAALAFLTGVPLAHADDSDDRSRSTRTPIKHVILIIGENRSFDHVFATYVPPKGQTVSNLLSRGIVNKDGTPGPKVALARQWQATDTGTFANSPTKTQPYTILPDINTGGAPTYYDHVSFDKFVEANWNLHETISPLGRDNLPNPVASRSNPYVPLNQPAIGDLFDLFDFGDHGH